MPSILLYGGLGLAHDRAAEQFIDLMSREASFLQNLQRMLANGGGALHWPAQFGPGQARQRHHAPTRLGEVLKHAQMPGLRMVCELRVISHRRM